MRLLIMKRIQGIFIIIAFLFVACHKKCLKRDVPLSIEAKTEQFKTTCCKKDASVKEYTFQNKTVYVFNPGICGADMTSEVVNENCETQGYLGGLSGNTKINGESFDKAKFISTYWGN